MLYLTAFLTTVLTAASAIYIPERGDDWTTLKPAELGPGLATVDFNFGISVSVLDAEFKDTTPGAKAVSCKSDSTLSMSLTGGILRDGNNRIGTIVSNHQFQFDGPTPQYGAIYANGWSIDDSGNLNLGNTSVFYQCASGDYYNLYDEKIGDQCVEVALKTVGLMDCE